MDRANNPRRSYTSYVLHVWHTNGQRSRRATLQATATGQRYNFASFEALFAFLDAQFNSPPEHADATGATHVRADGADVELIDPKTR